MLSEERLRELATALSAVDGIVGVALGGSRARGAEHADSDVDLGLYYRGRPDTEGLRRLAATWATDRDRTAPPEISEPGGWGPWVDGGGWLQVDDTPVDWILRDVDRVATAIERAVRGEFSTGFQVGHPFGFLELAYAGELALGVLLADPRGELADLRRPLDPYPPALRDSVVAQLWECDFILGGLATSAGRGDTTVVAGGLFRVVAWCAHVLHARAGRWAINEKGLVDAAGRLPGAPEGFADRAHGVLATLGRTPESLHGSLAAAAALVAEVRTG